MTTFADLDTCPKHNIRLHWADHGSPRVCPECRAEQASVERIRAADSTHTREDAVLGFGPRQRRQDFDA